MGLTMKIGIISDTHGSVTAWRLAVENCFKAVDMVIHCGDLLYHGPRNPLPEGYDPKALAQEINSFQKPLVIVRGNCDAEVDQMMLDLPIESPYAHVITPNFQILAHHGHGLSPESMPPRWFAAKTPLLPVILSGHTHIPELNRTAGWIALNPGSPALPKTETGGKTVAVIDGDCIAILNINNGQPIKLLTV